MYCSKIDNHDLEGEIDDSEHNIWITGCSTALFPYEIREDELINEGKIIVLAVGEHVTPVL